jgi:hypothetical protein
MENKNIDLDYRVSRMFTLDALRESYNVLFNMIETTLSHDDTMIDEDIRDGLIKLADRYNEALFIMLGKKDLEDTDIDKLVKQIKDQFKKVNMGVYS